MGANNSPYCSCQFEWGFLEPGGAGEPARHLGPELPLGPDLESQGWEVLLDPLLPGATHEQGVATTDFQSLTEESQGSPLLGLRSYTIFTMHGHL